MINVLTRLRTAVTSAVGREGTLADRHMGPWDALGLTFNVRCPDPQLNSYIGELLTGLPPAVDIEEPVHFDIDQVPAQETWSTGLAIETLIANINTGAIAAASGNLLFHAGAACGPDGEAAVICGPSGSGKSTLTARLVESGLAYLTDEVTCVDPIDLRMTPFRKPLALKRGSQPLFAHLESRFDPASARLTDDVWLIPFKKLGGASLPTVPLVPRLLIFPEYESGERLSVHRLRPGEAAFRLGENSSRLRAVRGAPLPALARLVTEAHAYRLVHSDVHAAADQVRELLTA